MFKKIIIIRLCFVNVQNMIFPMEEEAKTKQEPTIIIEEKLYLENPKNAFWVIHQSDNVNNSAASYRAL